MNRRERVSKAFRHELPDRTPLFEIFQPFQPIYWKIAGRTIATDQKMCWDALSEGLDRREFIEASARAQFAICKYFDLDMVRLTGLPIPVGRPTRTGDGEWVFDGVKYEVNSRTKMVEAVGASAVQADSNKYDEAEWIRSIQEWDGQVKPPPEEPFLILEKVRSMALKEGLDWVFMGEIGAGTAAAFYPPFMLMWLIDEPEMLRRWIDMKKKQAFLHTEKLIAGGCSVIAMGGDVSSDKGPFISPAHYREFILPVIQEHVNLIHREDAFAVYTSDGNHWPIKEDFFFNSGIDGYKEVDKAAGMTVERLFEEGIFERICVIGNIDARHTLCHGTSKEVEREVIHCLNYGRKKTGGHILHASHSVHEDVNPENYYTMVNTYRKFFDLPLLPEI